VIYAQPGVAPDYDTRTTRSSKILMFTSWPALDIPTVARPTARPVGEIAAAS